MNQEKVDIAGAPLTPDDIKAMQEAHERGMTPATALLHGQLSQMSAEDRQLCMLIALRGFRYLQDAAKAGLGKGFVADPLTLSLDIAVAHLCRTLNLRAFLDADDFAFCQELGTIVRFIDRKLAIIPPLITLRFAVR